MKYFLALLVLLALSYKNVKAQQLIIKCGNNSITIDSTARVEESFFNCDSVGIEIIKPHGTYEMQIIRMNKNNPAWVYRVEQKPKEAYYLNSRILAQDYQDVSNLIVSISRRGKFIKAFSIVFNYKQETH
jgi:hypothetical protein